MAQLDVWQVAPLIGVGGYELLVWIVDPFRVHTALNDGQPMNVVPRILAGGVNGGLWLWLSGALVKGHKKTTAALLPFVASFTMNQWLFWWWPYLLGSSAGLIEMVEEHKNQLENLPRVLPNIGDHLVPSIEHTILQPLSLFTLVRLLRTLRLASSKAKKPLLESKREKTIFIVSSAIFTSINVVGALRAYREGGAKNIGGSLLTAAQVGYVNWLLWKAGTSE